LVQQRLPVPRFPPATSASTKLSISSGALACDRLDGAASVHRVVIREELVQRCRPD